MVKYIYLKTFYFNILGTVGNKSLAEKRGEKLKKKNKAKETRSTARDVETRQPKPLPGPVLNRLKKAKDSNEIKLSWTVSDHFIVYTFIFLIHLFIFIQAILLDPEESLFVLKKWVVKHQVSSPFFLHVLFLYKKNRGPIFYVYRPNKRGDQIISNWKL